MGVADAFTAILDEIAAAKATVPHPIRGTVTHADPLLVVLDDDPEGEPREVTDDAAGVWAVDDIVWLELRGTDLVVTSAPGAAQAVRDTAETAGQLVATTRETPAQVTGVALSSAIAMDSDGRARGVVTVTWAAVTTNTSGGALEVASYDVATRPSASAPWTIRSAGSPPFEVRNLDPGSVLQVQVRARGRYATTPGAYSAVVSVTVAADTTPPPVPTPPALTSQMGVVTAVWDGLGAGNVAMPADFSHLMVFAGLAATPTAVTDQLAGPGAVQIAAERGQTIYVRAKTVDKSGNQSAYCAVRQIAVSSVLDDTGLGERLAGMDTATTQAKADAAQAIAGAAAAHGLASAASTAATAANNAAAAADAKADAAAAAAGTADGKATQALTSANGRNSRITSTSAPSGSTHPTTGLPLVAGDIWWQWDNVTARNVIGQWEWSGTAWRRELISDQTIASLDLNKLTVAGSARMSQAVADKVIADAGYYGSLTADRMIVASSENMIPWNPALGVAPHIGFAGASLAASNEPYYGWTIRPSGGTNTEGTWGYFMQLRPEAPSRLGSVNDWDVTPGESFRFRVGFGVRGSWTAAAATRRVRVVIAFPREDGTWAGSAIGNEVEPITAADGTLRYSEAIGTVPAGIVRMRVFLQRLYGNDTGVSLWVGNPTLCRATDGSLVVEGSITGREIFFDEAFGNKLKAGFAEFDSVLVGAMDGKVITGALFQTVDQSNRGIKLTDTFLRAWNATGVQTFDLNASSGALSVNGATITGGLFQTNSAANSGIKISGDAFRMWNAAGTEEIATLNSAGELYLKKLSVDGGVLEKEPSFLRLSESGNSTPALQISPSKIDLYWGAGAAQNFAGADSARAYLVGSSIVDPENNAAHVRAERSGRVQFLLRSGGAWSDQSFLASGEVRMLAPAPAFALQRQDNATGLYMYPTSNNSYGEIGIQARVNYVSNTGAATLLLRTDGSARIFEQESGVTRYLPFAMYPDIRSVTPAAANTTYSYTIKFPNGLFTKTPAISVSASTSVPERVVVSYGSASSTSVTIYYRRTDTTAFSISVIAFQPTP